MQTQYDLWKSEQLPSQRQENEVNGKIGEVIIGLNVYYGLHGITENEILAIQGFIQTYIKKYQRFKLCDIDRSLELFKKRPELNKLCPEYFETCFEKYRKSEERKFILKEYENDLEAHKNEIEAPKKQYSADELLLMCFENWKKSNTIALNTGAVYELNYQKILDVLGLERMQEIRKQVKSKLISEIEDKLSRPHQPIRDFLELQLKQVKDNGVALKVEVRKAHLKFYFETL